MKHKAGKPPAAGADDIGVAPGEFGHCEPPDFTKRHPPRDGVPVPTGKCGDSDPFAKDAAPPG